jgi:hypothetical protein
VGSLHGPQCHPHPVVPVRHGLALLVALAVALAAAVPAAAQQPSHKPGAGKAGHSLVGLPLFSSDGKRIGRIVASGTADNSEAVLVAEIERPLGIGVDAVAIPFAMLVHKPGRLQLTITAAEVEERIAKAGRER